MNYHTLTALTFIASAALLAPAFAQTSSFDPAVMAIIGDISTPSAREKIMRSVKNKPNSKSCKAGEWEKLGFRHAYDYGVGGDDYDARWAMVQKKCAKAKVTVDKARYDAGYKEGSLLYCGYETGIVHGYYFNKPTTAPQCETLDTPNHDRGYEAGKIIHVINNDRLELKKTLAALTHNEEVFLTKVDGQPSTVEEQDLYDELTSLTAEVETELKLYQAKYDALSQTYQLKGIYRRCAQQGQCAPDMDLDYEIPPMPQPMP